MPTPLPMTSNVYDFRGTQEAKVWKCLMENSRNSGNWKELRSGDYKGKSYWLTDNWETDVRICGRWRTRPRDADESRRTFEVY